MLLGSVAVVTLLAAAGIGLLARRHRTAAMVLLIGLTGLAGRRRPAASGRLGARRPARAGGRSGRRGRPRRPPAAGGADRRGQRAHRGPRKTPEPLEGSAQESGAPGTAARRTFLLGAAGVGAAAAIAGTLGQKLASNPTVPTAAALPLPQTVLPELPAGLEKRVPGISAFRTPNADFYRVDTALVIPRVDVRQLELRSTGTSSSPSRSSFAELLEMPMIEKRHHPDLRQQRGRRAATSARPAGSASASEDLLERAGVEPRRRPDPQPSTDGMTISTPVQALTDDRDALVAVAMNGAAAARQARLPGAAGHPRPVRLRRRHQVAGPAHGHDLRRRSRPTGPSAAGPPTRPS